ncbi:MAG TPA: isoprenyl transferase [Terriglobales bacterium]|jgi:undecaprenyl diphosphate synthase
MSHKETHKVEPKEGLSAGEARKFSALDHDPEKLPRHIAIIMDGNGRWARKRHLPRFVGHRQGMASVRAVVETAARIHLPYITLYAFSAENWKRRPTTEVSFLFGLLKEYLKKEVENLNRNNVRLNYIGRIHELPRDIQDALEEARLSTVRNSGLVLTLALNYGSRDEIVDAARALASAVKRGELTLDQVDEHSISRCMYTRNMPDPDLLIRTSGEMRISNYLLWQIAYSEIHITDKLWPDFKGIDLIDAIGEYQKRERRYGGLGKDPADVSDVATNHEPAPEHEEQETPVSVGK